MERPRALKADNKILNLASATLITELRVSLCRMGTMRCLGGKFVCVD